MKKIPLFLLMSFLLTCCSFPHHQDNTTHTDSENAILDSNEMYKAFFNRKNKIEIELQFTNQAIRKLQDYGNTKDERKDMYHPCDMLLKINDEEYFIKEVGARMKGNTSRTNNFVNIFNKFNLNRYINLKLSFNQTFDDAEDNDYYIRTWDDDTSRDARKDRKLAHQKKIDTRWNKDFDHTFTKAAYAFYMYEEEGIAAQKDNIVKLTVKNESDSVSYLIDIAEAIDSTFLKNHLSKSEAKGNLYKCLYSEGPANFTKQSLTSIGIETPSWTPIYDLKTNDDVPDHTLLTTLINTLNDDKSDAATFKQKLDSMIDVDHFLKYSALSWVIGNPDDMRNNSNNFYTYFRSTDNKMMIIPYDMDRCFGILQDWPMHMEDYPYDSFIQVPPNIDIKNPLFYRTIVTGNNWQGYNYKIIEEYKNRYESLCIEYAHKYLDTNKFQSFTNDFYWVDKNINYGGEYNLSFTEYCNHKLETLR